MICCTTGVFAGCGDVLHVLKCPQNKNFFEHEDIWMGMEGTGFGRRSGRGHATTRT